MSILTGHARLAGVMGWPVRHSRSPRIHGYWLRRYRIDGAYVPLSVRPEAFSRALEGLRACGFRGVNVTLPHKVAALSVCDTVDEAARRIGAVNTLSFGDEGITGRNTDGFGFIAGLEEAHIDPAAGPALILGAGGAARAIAVALLDLGVEATVTNRTEARAIGLARDLSGLRVLEWTHRSSALGDFSLLVNATSLGMEGQPPLHIDLAQSNSALAVADIVYSPLQTELLGTARERGLRTADGLAMLLHQARPGFASWFDIDPEVDAELRSFVLADLQSP